jgi:hypothetical protein
MTRLVSTILVASFCFGLCHGADQVISTQLDSARSNIDKWVETRQLIARTRGEWSTERETLQQSVDLIEKEIQLLDEQIAQAESTVSQADSTRLVLAEENERLSAAAAVIGVALANLEQQTTNLAIALPTPLQERIRPLLKRIPMVPDQTRLSISERMQSIVGVLSEVDKFNNAISVFPEIRQIDSGAEIQVKTLYVGLGAAFFADKNGVVGGVGVPTAQGWEWTSKSEVAADIARAIAVYENTQAAQFVTLPVTVK